MAWTLCPDCNQPMEVDHVDNGVMMVWHGTHCGWGQAYMADKDVFPTREALLVATASPPAQNTSDR